MRIAVVSLSSCLGCQMALLDLEEYLISFISENSISYAPFILDHKRLDYVDLALVEGAVRDGGHFRAAKEVREKAAQVVALGTCACYGGVQGLADMVSENRLMRRRFGDAASFEGAPQGTGRLLPLASCIAVDAFLPGCPPPASLLKSFLTLAISGTLHSREGSSVCSECGVTGATPPQPGPRRAVEAVPVAGKCLLEQGFVCMGPLTRDGCGARCPSELGVVCSGCRGPSDPVLKYPGRDLRQETLRRLARATGKRSRSVEEAIKDPAHSLYRYCIAEPLLRLRRPPGTSTFLYRTGGPEER